MTRRMRRSSWEFSVSARTSTRERGPAVTSVRIRVYDESGSLVQDETTPGPSALQVLSAVRRSGLSLAELTADLPLLPQKLINVRIQKGFDWRAHPALGAACADAEASLGNDGRILIRPSGTEPLLRVMVEARDEAVAEQTARRIAESISA